MKGENFSQRSSQSELMDTEPVGFPEFHDCLRELETINDLTLAYRPTVSWLERQMKTIGSSQTISILDIGCGGGDMLRHIWKRFGERNFDLTGIDLNPWSKQSAELVTPKGAPIRYETVNLFSLDPSRRADFIISSLFTHHLTDPELVRFIQWMDHHAARGWYINDLHRHALPFTFIKYAVRIFSRNRLIVHDAPVSVARAFTAADWHRLLTEAGIPAGRCKIEWFFPFRYGVSCWKA